MHVGTFVEAGLLD